MRTIHDTVTPQMRSRLKTIAMGLGLVRLLQDARRFDEARTTLYSLDNASEGIADLADESGPEFKTNSFSSVHASANAGQLTMA